MNIEELHWFTQEDLPPSGSFGNIRVTKKRLSWEVKTVSPLQKSQPIIITIQAFALLRSHKKTITRDIDEGLAFLEKLATPDNRESNNLSLFQNIIVLLANKIYKRRVKSICIPCMRADGENINEFPTIHGCATEDNFTKSLRGRESLRAVTNDLLKCVLLCNNITPPKQDVMEIVGENHTELVGKVVQGLISCEAQRCFEVYYDVNSAVF